MILRVVILLLLSTAAHAGDEVLASKKIRQYCFACHASGSRRFIYSESDEEMWDYIFNHHAPGSGKLWAEGIRDVLNWPTNSPPPFNQYMVSPSQDWMPKGVKRLQLSEEMHEGMPMRQFILETLNQSLEFATADRE